jgi:multiple sugar transport system substrate-binding protein
MTTEFTMRRISTAHPRRRHRALIALGVAAALVGSLAACSTSSSSATGGAVTKADEFGTASHPITLTFWGWGSEKDTAMLAAYKRLHPHVTIDTSELGSTAALYTKLATVFKAGTGIPDLTALELPNLSSFAAGGKNLAPISPYGANVSQFDKSAVQGATFDGKLYAVPTDYGPMVMYYRKDVFAKYGLSVPTTWAEYLTEAAVLKQRDPSQYMTYADPGDSTPTLGLIWQAGGHPFRLSGQNKLTIDLHDAGAKKYADLWSTMLQKGYANPTPGFTAAWFNQLGAGDYATWFAGAWGTSVLQQSVPQSAGKWGVTTLPNWSASDPSDGAMGGSGTVVTQASKHKAAAVAFAQWYGSKWPLENVGKAGGATFPASLTVQKDSAYASAPAPVLGGQVAAPLYIKASSEVRKDWQFVPYNIYAGTVFKDTTGQEIASGYDISKGLDDWQQQLASYGKEQGYDVVSK